MQPVTRPTGVTLTRLNLLDLTATVGEKVREARPDDEKLVGVTLGVGAADYAITEHDGDTYVICTEGVGWKVTEEKPLELDVYLDYGPNFISIAPSFTVTLPLSKVREIPTGETVDLADFIRRFGARLESNFAIWHHTLSA